MKRPAYCRCWVYKYLLLLGLWETSVSVSRYEQIMCQQGISRNAHYIRANELFVRESV